MGQQNLSEKLFKPKFNYPETTSLIQRIDASTTQFSSVLEGESNSRWYRVLNTLLWHWRGIPTLEIEAVLSRIAVSDKKHSDDNWLDSVIGYQSGNWIYEFLTQAAEWAGKAEQICQLDTECPIEDLDRPKMHEYWLTASQFASIASYPHYKTDDLAAQAQSYAYRAYKEALEYSPFTLKEIDFKVDSSVVKGLLHLPTSTVSDKPCPVLFMCTGLTNLQIDFYKYFADYLAPLGIALLTIDSPGIGLSRQFNLSQNSTQLHQAVLEQLSNVPWVDHTKVIVSGFRVGAQMATRLAYLMPNRIKGLLNFGPIIHQLFVDKAVQQTLPAMYKDLIASRLGLNRISNVQLLAELNYFSLKNQGLINRPCNAPVMSIVFEGDNMSTEAEAKLIMSSQKHQIVKIEAKQITPGLQKAMEKSTDWIKELIK
ncbi:esterase FrsA [Zophobihabitans entericus]|uniref:Esterase FrsA n=1 Tax=Zophobihabitans entericus TaxID=1635327 RepID=A0A6G9IC15_9GAMM|nr:esterase FrsA [Zophobihabitans entericus]QIQ21377.1 esterase FrsA [Zophobihabitans entericus]